MAETMLTGILLDTPPPADPWWQRMDALRALGYALLAAGDSGLAEQRHDAGGTKPFTLCVWREEGCLRIRVTGLEARTSAALKAAARALSDGETARFGQTTLRVTGASLYAPPYAGTSDYARLAQARFAPQVALEFPTPTAFRLAGETHLPLPVPDLMLRSWARRWNEFAPPEMEVTETVLESMSSRVGLARAKVETTTVAMRSGKVVGFTGHIVLEALRPAAWPEAEKRTFAALTAYSCFCGTGVRTTQGMGLTLPE